MTHCDKCTVDDICTQCADGFYWWVEYGICKDFVECGSDTYESWTHEGE